jgi:hypothetical protein
MPSTFALTLSALAATSTMGMALEPRQSSPAIRFVSARRLDGDCPAGSFYLKPGGSGQPFGTYYAYVGPADPSSNREKFWNFEVVLEFPCGCTTGNLRCFPGATPSSRTRVPRPSSSRRILCRA